MERNAGETAAGEGGAGESARLGRLLVAACALFVGCLLLLSAPGLGPPPASAGEGSPAPVASATVEVYATGQSLGSLEPCECVEGMAGGFPRRLSLLAREAKLRPGPRLVVDLGDLTGKAFHPRLLEAKTQAALELLRRSGALVVVGDLDLRLGVARLAELGREAGVPLLAANLSLGGQRPFQGSALRSFGGQPWRVIGVLDPSLCPPDPELECEDPALAIRRELAREPAARGIVLFHGEVRAAEALAKALAKVPGVALVVCGQDQQERRPLRFVEGVALVEVVRDARSVARVSLGASPTLRHLGLGGGVPDDAWARERIDRYYREVADLPEPPRRPPPAGGDFVGAQTCQACHPAQFEVFAKTPHHGAQARIARLDPKRARLGECTVCHVTGFGYEGGFTSLADTPQLGEVGCEACHGVGGRHAQQGGGKGFGVRAGFPGSWKALCVTCHDQSNSPGFEFEQALGKIKHWRDR